MSKQLFTAFMTKNIPCREDANGRIEFYQGGAWRLNPGFEKHCDTLRDSATKAQVDQLIKTS